MSEIDRSAVKPTLVYWHCNTWWALSEGPACPMVHDTPIYDDRLRRGRKRLVWLCHNEVAFLSRKVFLEHDEEDCYGQD